MSPAISFLRLPEIPLAQVVALLNEPRNRRHLPLAGVMSEDDVADWVQAKDAQWSEHGYGPWAILLDGDFAGWGGFQAEENGADFALVLAPPFWGHGLAVTMAALERGFGELGLDAVLIALPYSRRPDQVVARFGFRPDGEATYGGVRFRQYRLLREDWRPRTG